MAKRFYAPYTQWEDYKCGMFGIEVKLDQVEKSRLLLASEHLESVMIRVVKDWPVSSKHNLTNISSNRRSWLGQAACCMNHGATEYETRLAWRELTKEQQIQANCYADIAIKTWEQLNNFNKNEFIKEDFTL